MGESKELGRSGLTGQNRDERNRPSHRNLRVHRVVTNVHCLVRTDPQFCQGVIKTLGIGFGGRRAFTSDDHLEKVPRSLAVPAHKASSSWRFAPPHDASGFPSHAQTM